MIAVFFEVTPRSGQEGHYLDIAGALKPELDKNTGLLFLERYNSLSRAGTLLSHQIWSDEASLTRWRTNDRHHGAQQSGRDSVFEDYRLRVGVVIAETSQGGVAPVMEGIAYNDPLLQPERFVVVVRSFSEAVPLAESGESFESVYRPGEFVWLDRVSDRTAGYDALADAGKREHVSAAQLVLVSRDYGLLDRREAPQHFPTPAVDAMPRPPSRCRPIRA
ncbi:MAG: antibiotic biosynthesis monooxygenase family protein [Hyphomicrobiaceae bacterium]